MIHDWHEWTQGPDKINNVKIPERDRERKRERERRERDCYEYTETTTECHFEKTASDISVRQPSQLDNNILLAIL